MADRERRDPFAVPSNAVCSGCKERPATTAWSSEGVFSALHGNIEFVCQACAASRQMVFAMKSLARIPELHAEVVGITQQELEKAVSELRELRAFNSALHERITGTPSENELHLATAVDDLVKQRDAFRKRAEAAEFRLDSLHAKAAVWMAEAAQTPRRRLRRTLPRPTEK